MTTTIAPTTTLGVHSEVGKLRKVMVCKPGLAHLRLTPENCHDLLFDDVIWVQEAETEHYAFAEQMRDRGDDPEKLGEAYGDMINAAMSDIPPDMAITMHLCRGNYKSTLMGAGGYDAVQEILFNKINVHGYFMEYDDERAGTFEPLRFLPPDKSVVLGLVSSKLAQLESSEDLLRRIDEASRYVPLENLALSPQCGFASTMDGNLLTEDDQWRKLELVVATARKVWG